MALTREILDHEGCGNPACTHDHTVLFLHASCHPHHGTQVSYDKRTGAVSIECVVCERLIAEIAVAHSELVQ